MYKERLNEPLARSSSVSVCVLKCLYTHTHTHSYTYTLYAVWSEFMLIQVAITSVSFSCRPSESQAAAEVWHTSLFQSLSVFPLSVSLYSSVSLSLFCVAILVLYPLIVCLPSFLPLPLLCCSTLLLLLPPSPPRLPVFVDSLPSLSLSLALVSLTVKPATAATAVAPVAHSSQFSVTAEAAVCVTICVCVCVSHVCVFTMYVTASVPAAL